MLVKVFTGSRAAGMVWMIWDFIPGMAKRFSLLRNVLTDSGAHPASYSVGTVVLSLGLKQLAQAVDHSLPSHAKVKNEWSCTCVALHAFLVWTGVDAEIMASLRARRHTAECEVNSDLMLT